MTRPHELNVADAGRLIRNRALSPVELVDDVLAHVERVDPVIASYITVTAQRARDAALCAEAEIAAGRWRGPLHGIPYGLKDNIDVAGVPTTANSRLLRDYVPLADATVQQRLAAAGAILIGKLSTYEFGTGTGADAGSLLFPPSRNPWNPAHFTGGSSTGAGAAVAAGTALFAIGADTGGSIRLPAAGCGVYGLKPSFGLVSRSGTLPNAWSLDHIGPLARTAADTALILSAIAGHDPADAASAQTRPGDYGAGAVDLRSLRIGMLRALDDPAMDQEVSAAIAAVAADMKQLGATIVPVELAATHAMFIDCARVINPAESFAIHRRAWREERQLMGPALVDKLFAGACIPASAYLDAQRWRRMLTAQIERALDGVDVLLCAGVATAAPRLDDLAAVADFTSRSSMAAFSLSGHPALSIPAGFGRGGLPLAAQLVGHRFDEARLLGIARAYDAATGWSAARPQPSPGAASLVAAAVNEPVPDAGELACANARVMAARAGIAAPSDWDLNMIVRQSARAADLVSRLPDQLSPELEPMRAQLVPVV